MHMILYINAVLFLCSTIISALENAPKKRQIFREQVLPHYGGKIPDTAFQTDRLFLNRLQSEGIAVPDGVVPETRNPLVNQYHNKSPRTVYRIALSSDGRFTPEVGKYHYRDVPSVETTYLYPLTHIQNGRFATTATASSTSLRSGKSIGKPSPVYPVYRQFQLHNPHLNQVKLQAHKKTYANIPNNDISTNINTNNNKNNAHSTNSHKTTSYQNFNIYNRGSSGGVNAKRNPIAVAPAVLDVPTVKVFNIKTDAHKHSPNDYDANQLITEFDELFNNFDLYEPGSSNLAYHYKPYTRTTTN